MHNVSSHGTDEHITKKKVATTKNNNNQTSFKKQLFVSHLIMNW